ncbi:hypothetical protein EJB05_20728, partial [Eragrostis curvula]
GHLLHHGDITDSRRRRRAIPLARCRPPPHLRSSSYAAAAPPLEFPEVEKVLRDVRVFPVGEGGLHGAACADDMVVRHRPLRLARPQHRAGAPLQGMSLLLPTESQPPTLLFEITNIRPSGSILALSHVRRTIIIHALEERAREYYDLEVFGQKRCLLT